MSSHSITGTILGVAVIYLVIDSICCRGLHRHGQRRVQEIRRGPETVAKQTFTSYHLETAQMFGLYIKGPIAISQNTIDTFQNQINQSYKDINCTKALDKNSCSSYEVLIARHEGQFQGHYARHYNGFSYGNSVTGADDNPAAATLVNDVETISRTTRSADCSGPVFKCTVSDDVREKIKQKCWLLDLYGATAHLSSDSLHNFKSHATKLTWSDISAYLRKVGNKLLPPIPSSSSVDTRSFYKDIYDEIKCGIGNIVTDSREKKPNDYYKRHADLIRDMHIRFHRLRHATDNGIKRNCFSHLLRFMEVLTKVANGSDESWNDIILAKTWRNWRMNGFEQYYTNKTANTAIHFCHHQILIEYSCFVRERYAMIQEIQNKSGCYSGCNFDFNNGTLYNMTDRIFNYLTRLLYKTFLMTNPKGRLTNVTKENDQVEKASDKALSQLQILSSCDVNDDIKQYWDKYMKIVKRKIKNEKKRRGLITT